MGKHDENPEEPGRVRVASIAKRAAVHGCGSAGDVMSRSLRHEKQSHWGMPDVIGRWFAE
jgi:hypothetical protein